MNKQHSKALAAHYAWRAQLTRRQVNAISHSIFSRAKAVFTTSMAPWAGLVEELALAGGFTACPCNELPFTYTYIVVTRELPFT